MDRRRRRPAHSTLTVAVLAAAAALASVAATLAGWDSAGAAPALSGSTTSAAGDPVTLTDLPPLPEGQVAAIGLEAPWAYAAVRTPGEASSAVWRARDDGSTAWEALEDPSTGAQARTGGGLVVGGARVLVDTGAGQPGGCVRWREVGRSAALATCSDSLDRPSLDASGLVALPLADRSLDVYDLPSATRIGRFLSGVFHRGRVWQAGTDELVALDPRSKEIVSRLTVPDGCRRSGWRLLRATLAGPTLECAGAEVVLDVDRRRAPEVVDVSGEVSTGFATVQGVVQSGSTTLAGVRVVDLGIGGHTEVLRADSWRVDSGGGPSLVLRAGSVVSVARLALSSAAPADTVAPAVAWSSVPPAIRGPAREPDYTFSWSASDAGSPERRGVFVELGWSDHGAGLPLPSSPAQRLDPRGALGGLASWELGRPDAACLHVRAVDVAGNTSPWLRHCTVQDVSAPEVTFEFPLMASLYRPDLRLRGLHRVAWSGWDDVAIASYVLELRDAPTGRAFGPWVTAVRTTGRAITRRVAVGTTSCYRLRVVDKVGLVTYASYGGYPRPVVCLDPPRDDRRLDYRGSGRVVRNRSAYGVADTTTDIGPRTSIVVRERGVRQIQIGHHSRTTSCPRVRVGSRVLRVRCSKGDDYAGRAMTTIDLRGTWSGRFVITPRSAMRVDYLVPVRRP